jgi:hypothetical protein
MRGSTGPAKDIFAFDQEPGRGWSPQVRLQPIPQPQSREIPYNTMMNASGDSLS